MLMVFYMVLGVVNFAFGYESRLRAGKPLLALHLIPSVGCCSGLLLLGLHADPGGRGQAGGSLRG